MLSGLAEAQLSIDLDSRRYHDPQALTVYIHQLLLASQEPGITTPYQGDRDETAATVAAAIARRATSGDRRTEFFLIGRFLALSVRSRTEPVDIASPDWQSGLPAGLRQAFEEDLARLGEKTSLARTLLEALAWAKGPGLPWENIWVPVARALADHNRPGQRLITDEDVRWLLDQAGAYVVEDRGPGQRSAYRPFHELLAAHLRGEPPTTEQASVEPAVADAWQRHIVQTEKTVIHALLETVPTSAHGRDWMSAHPYLRTYLAQHAAAARIELSTVVDTNFLAAAAWVTLPSPSPRPEPDLAELRDEQIRLLRQSAMALEHLMDSSAELDYVTLRSVDYGLASARMRRSLNEVDELLRRLIDVTTWPDPKWALSFNAAMARVRQDLRVVERQFSMATTSPRTIRLRHSVATLRQLLTERYPTIFIR